MTEIFLTKFITNRVFTWYTSMNGDLLQDWKEKEIVYKMFPGMFHIVLDIKGFYIDIKYSLHSE